MARIVASEAQVPTPAAQRFIDEMYGRFAHRLAAEASAAEGSIALACGTCRMEARPDLLVLRAEAGDEAALGQIETILALHLQRLALRETHMIAWRRA